MTPRGDVSFHEQKVLSDEEFEREKAKLLDQA